MTKEELQYLKDSLKDPQAVQLLEVFSHDHDLMYGLLAEAFQALEGGSIGSLYSREDNHPDVPSWIEMAAEVVGGADEEHECEDCGGPLEPDDKDDLPN